MRQKRLSNICKEILHDWKEREIPDEEQTSILLDGIIDHMMDGQGEMVPDYQRLSDMLERLCQYRDFEGISAEEIFLLGEIWGSIRLSKLYDERQKYQENTEKLMIVYRKNFSFFHAIHRNPGICHKDLARKIKKSPSQLSQLVSRLAHEDLITCSYVGREKHYYLRKRGEFIYKALEKDRKCQSTQPAFGSCRFPISRSYGPKEAMCNSISYMDHAVQTPAFINSMNNGMEFMGNTEPAMGKGIAMRRRGDKELCQPVMRPMKSLLNNF